MLEMSRDEQVRAAVDTLKVLNEYMRYSQDGVGYNVYMA